MKFLKVLALVILSLLLFVSLSIFSLAPMLNYTILNPGFIVSEINRLDIALATEELLTEESVEKDFPPELRSSLVATIPSTKSNRS